MKILRSYRLHNPPFLFFVLGGETAEQAEINERASSATMMAEEEAESEVVENETKGQLKETQSDIETEAKKTEEKFADDYPEIYKKMKSCEKNFDASVIDKIMVYGRGKDPSSLERPRLGGDPIYAPVVMEVKLKGVYDSWYYTIDEDGNLYWWNKKKNYYQKARQYHINSGTGRFEKNPDWKGDSADGESNVYGEDKSKTTPSEGSETLSNTSSEVLQVKEGDTLGALARGLARTAGVTFNYDMPVDYRSQNRSAYEGDYYKGKYGKVEDFKNIQLRNAHWIFPGQYVWLENGKIVVDDELKKVNMAGMDAPENELANTETKKIDMSSIDPPENEFAENKPPESGEIILEDPENEGVFEKIFGISFSDWWDKFSKENSEAAGKMEEDLGEKPSSWGQVVEWIKNAGDSAWDGMKTAAHWVWHLPGKVFRWLFSRTTWGIGEKLENAYNGVTDWVEKGKEALKEKVGDAWDFWKDPEKYNENRWNDFNENKEKLSALIDATGKSDEDKNRLKNLLEIEDIQSNEESAEKEAKEERNKYRIEMQEALEDIQGVWNKKDLEKIQGLISTDLRLGAQYFSDDALTYMNAENTEDDLAMTLYGVENLYLDNFIAGPSEKYFEVGGMADQIDALGNMIKNTNASDAKTSKLKIHLENFDTAGTKEAGKNILRDLSVLSSVGDETFKVQDKLDEVKANREKLKDKLDEYPNIKHNFEVENSKVKEAEKEIKNMMDRTQSINDQLTLIDNSTENEPDVSDVLDDFKKQDLLTYRMIQSLGRDNFDGKEITFDHNELMIEARGLDQMKLWDFNKITFNTKNLTLANVKYEDVEKQDFNPQKAYSYKVEKVEGTWEMKSHEWEAFVAPFHQMGEGSVIFKNLENNDTNKAFMKYILENGLGDIVVLEGSRDLKKFYEETKAESINNIAENEEGIDLIYKKNRDEMVLEEGAETLTADDLEGIQKMDSVPDKFVNYILSQENRNNLGVTKLDFTNYRPEFLVPQEETLKKLAAIPIEVEGGKNNILGERINEMRNTYLQGKLKEIEDTYPQTSRLDEMEKVVKPYINVTRVDKNVANKLNQFYKNELENFTVEDFGAELENDTAIEKTDNLKKLPKKIQELDTKISNLSSELQAKEQSFIEYDDYKTQITTKHNELTEHIKNHTGDWKDAKYYIEDWMTDEYLYPNLNPGASGFYKFFYRIVNKAETFDPQTDIIVEIQELDENQSPVLDENGAPKKKEIPFGKFDNHINAVGKLVNKLETEKTDLEAKKEKAQSQKSEMEKVEADMKSHIKEKLGYGVVKAVEEEVQEEQKEKDQPQEATETVKQPPTREEYSLAMDKVTNAKGKTITQLLGSQKDLLLDAIMGGDLSKPNVRKIKNSLDKWLEENQAQEVTETVKQPPTRTHYSLAMDKVTNAKGKTITQLLGSQKDLLLDAIMGGDLSKPNVRKIKNSLDKWLEANPQQQ